MKTINLTDEQFEQLKEYVIESCENIMDRSLEWADSELGNELIDNNEILAAGWYQKDDLPLIPPEPSLSNKLIKTTLDSML